MSKLQRALLLAILLYALLSRLAGITWGLELFDRYVGNSRYHPDEFKITVGAKNFPKDILSRTDLRYPTALHYMIGILGFPVRAAAGTAVDDTQFYLLIGRLLSVAFGVAAVYLTYRLTRKFAGANAGLIAAGLPAVSVYPVRESAVATTEMAVSFWALVVLLLTAKLTPEFRLENVPVPGHRFRRFDRHKIQRRFRPDPVRDLAGGLDFQSGLRPCQK